MQHANPGSPEIRTTSYVEEVPVYTARTDDCGDISTVAMRTGDCGAHVSTVAYTETLETAEPIETYSNPDRRIEVTEVSERPADVSLSSSSDRDRELARDRDFARESDSRDRDFEHDRDFVKEAALANLTEIELGREALKNAANEDVRRFGQRMIDDHSKAQSDLKAAAGSSFDVPNELDAEHRSMVEKHARLSGQEFDRAYLEMMVDDHSRVIREFERASESAKDRDIRDFASRTLPVLREHVSMARDTQTRMATDKSPKD